MIRIWETLSETILIICKFSLSPPSPFISLLNNGNYILTVEKTWTSLLVYFKHRFDKSMTSLRDSFYENYSMTAVRIK